MQNILGSAVLDCCEWWFWSSVKKSDFKSCCNGSIFSPPNCLWCTQNINIPFWRLFQDFLLSHRLNRWITLSAAVTHNYWIKESVFSKWSLFWQAAKSHLTRTVAGMMCVLHGSILNQSYVQKNRSRTKTGKDYMLEIQFAQALLLHMWLRSEYGQWLRGTPQFAFSSAAKQMCGCHCLRYAHSFTPPAGWPYYVSHHKSLTHNLSQSLRLNVKMRSTCCEKY